VHASLADCLASLGSPRWFAFTTRGSLRYDEPRYADGDALVFGPETRGLPTDVLESCPPERRLRIPMRPDARSLNLSNAVAVAVYEAWRQLCFGQN
jgi:tRNA (cytidine/uridine-2'-O-)-methyltransferase